MQAHHSHLVGLSCSDDMPPLNHPCEHDAGFLNGCHSSVCELAMELQFLKGWGRDLCTSFPAVSLRCRSGRSQSTLTVNSRIEVCPNGAKQTLMISFCSSGAQMLLTIPIVSLQRSGPKKKKDYQRFARYSHPSSPETRRFLQLTVLISLR